MKYKDAIIVLEDIDTSRYEEFYRFRKMFKRAGLVGLAGMVISYIGQRAGQTSKEMHSFLWPAVIASVMHSQIKIATDKCLVYGGGTYGKGYYKCYIAACDKFIKQLKDESIKAKKQGYDKLARKIASKIPYFEQRRKKYEKIYNRLKNRKN